MYLNCSGFYLQESCDSRVNSENLCFLQNITIENYFLYFNFLAWGLYHLTIVNLKAIILLSKPVAYEFSESSFFSVGQ